MSQLRRENQAKRLAAAKPTFATRIAFNLSRQWKTLLALFGVSSGLEILREYLRSKAMDWVLEKIGGVGSIGLWVATYPFALLTIAVVGAIFWLIWITLRDPDERKDAVILDSSGNAYQPQRLSRTWRRWFAVAAVICILFVGYGGYVYLTKIPLLEKYPLGYVIFDADYVTDAVTPLETRRGLEAYQFDFRPVRITQNTNDRIAIRLPDLIKNKQVVATGVETGGWKRVGNLGGAAIADDKGGVMELAEILAIKDSTVTFLVGFDRAPKFKP
jgi:hypothetical protein